MIICHDQVDVIPKIQCHFNISKKVKDNNIQHINRLKYINHMVISTDTDKAFNKARHLCTIKVLKKVGIGGPHLNITKAISSTSVYVRVSANRPAQCQSRRGKKEIQLHMTRQLLLVPGTVLSRLKVNNAHDKDLEEGSGLD